MRPYRSSRIRCHSSTPIVPPTGVRVNPAARCVLPPALNMATNKEAKVSKQQQQQQNRQPHRLQQQPGSPQHQGDKGVQHYSSHVQVFATDIDHNSPSVLLFFDKERYLFNAGEGLQRYFREHRIKITKIDHYLFTRICTETVAGLPGMLLSHNPGHDFGGLLDDQVVCTLHGPEGLRKYVGSFKSYANPGNLNVNEFGPMHPKPVIKTAVVSITPIPLSTTTDPMAVSDTSSALQTSEGSPTPADSEADQLAPQPKRHKTSHSQPAKAPPGAPAPGLQPRTVCYLCNMSGRPGKFNPKKAQELGVPRGPLFGELQRGLPVALDDGRVIQPGQVMEPQSIPGPLLVILDCPSLELLAAIRENKQLKDEIATAEAVQDKLCIMVHMGPQAVLEHPEHVAWRESCGHRWQHVLVSSHERQRPTIYKASVLQAKLNCLHQEVFPLPQLANIKKALQQQEQQDEEMLDIQPCSGDQLEPSDTGIVASGSQPANGTEQKDPTACDVAGDGSMIESDVVAAGRVPAAGVEAGPNSSQCTGDEPSNTAGVTEPLVCQGCQAVGAVAAAAISQPPVSQPSSTSQPPAPLTVLTTYSENNSTLVAATKTRAHLMPPAKQGFEMDNVPQALDAGPLQQHWRQQQTTVVQLAQEAITAGPSTQEDVPEALSQIARDEVALTWLGTVSSCPSKYRNVSGTYVDFFARGGLLVDCGEDSLGQLKRRFGAQDGQRRVLELQCVWVSHMHADHHGGLYRLLEMRAHAGAPPLLIIGPSPLFRVLRAYQAVVPLSFYFLPNSYFGTPSHGHPRVVAQYQAVLQQLGLSKLEAVPVEHIRFAYGLVLEGLKGWKVVFSGDTRPCNQIVQAANGATLLVHEATFEDELVEEAKQKKHSTTGEALEVAAKAGVYRAILTHFSSRYPTVPEFANSQMEGRVMIAMDLMTVNLADLPWLPRLLQPLAALFKAEEQGFQADDDGDE